MSKDRPKRNIIQKKYDDSDGIPWLEEREVRKVLYLSLKEFKNTQRNKVTDGLGTGNINGSFPHSHGCRAGPQEGLLAVNGKAECSRCSSQSNDGNSEYSGDDPVRKRPRLQAQRKFAQSQPSSPSATPVKLSETLLPPSPSSPLSDITRRKPKTEDFLTFLCLRGSAALPGNMAYFGSAQDDVDLDDEDDEEEECDDRMSAHSHNSTSVPSSQRKNKTTPGKKVSNGHVLNGHCRSLRGKELFLRPRGREAIQAPERTERGVARRENHRTSTGPPARTSSTTHSLRHSRPTQEHPKQVSKVNRLSRVSSTTVRNSCAKKPPASRPLPSRTVKSTAAALPRGHIPYTKARLLKEAKLTLGKRTSSKARQPLKNQRRPASGSARRHPHPPHSNSGKPSGGDAKTPNKQEVQSNKAAGRCCLQRVNGQLHPRRCGGKQVLQGREGVRHSKRRLGLPAEECPTETPESSPEVKKVRLQVNAPETRSIRKVNVQEKAVSGGHLGKVTSSRPSSSEQRPKRASAGKLMLTRQAQPIPSTANTTTTAITTPPAKNTNSKKTFQGTSKNTSHVTSKGTSTSTSTTSAAKVKPGTSSPAKPAAEPKAAERQRGERGSGEKRGAAPPPPLSLTEVPVFRPSLEEFHDPLVYVEAMRGQAESYGLCRVAPPQDWRPECKLKEDMRFVTQVQHIHKLGRRWGPNVLRLACIRKHLQAQGISMEDPPLIGGCELDLARFFQLINDMGGMQQVSDMKKWNKLADQLRIPKTAQDRLAKLQEAYCQYLLSYDSLDPADRTLLEKEVLEEKGRLEKKRGPLESHSDDSQQSLLQLPRCEPKNGLVNGVIRRNGLPRSLEEGAKEGKKQEKDMWLRSSRRRGRGGAEEEKSEEEKEVLSDQHKCIYRGKSVSLTTFYRTARNTMNMCFNKEPGTAEGKASGVVETGSSPPPIPPSASSSILSAPMVSPTTATIVSAPPSPEPKEISLRPAQPLRRPAPPALNHHHPTTTTYHDMLPAFMCPKETCDAPGTAEHTGPVTVVAPVRFDNRPTFRQPYPNNNQEPVNGEVGRGENRFIRGPQRNPSSRPIRRPGDRPPRPAIINPDDLKDLDELDNDCEDGWAGIHEEVDYGEKLKFSDDEEEHAAGEKNKRAEWENQRRERQLSLSSGEGSYPQEGPEEEAYLAYQEQMAHRNTNGRFPSGEAQAQHKSSGPGMAHQGDSLVDQEERQGPARAKFVSPELSEAVERARRRREEEERRAREERLAACAEKLKRLDEKFGKMERQLSRSEEEAKDGESKEATLSPGRESKNHPENWQYGTKDAECPLEHSPRQQDYRDKATSGFAPYRSEDDAGAESNSPLPPRFQKQQQEQVYKMQHWQQQSGHPAPSGSSHPQRGYYPPHVLGFDPRWMMMPPFMDPRMAQGRSPVDYYPNAVHSSGMMKPLMQPDHLNSPGSTSDDGCHPSMHQERRAPSTEPYPVWNQDGYPPRSFTPPYQRLHESSDRSQPDDRIDRTCSQQDVYEERGNECLDNPSHDISHPSYHQSRGPDRDHHSHNQGLLSTALSRTQQQNADGDYPKQEPKDGHLKDSTDHRNNVFDTSKEKGFDSDFWRRDGGQKKEGGVGVQNQWFDPGSTTSASSVSQPSETSGRTLTRRTGPIKKPVLKALKVEDKENEKPKVDPGEKVVPYRLEKEVLTNVYDLKKDNQPLVSNRRSASPAIEKQPEGKQHQPPAPAKGEQPSSPHIEDSPKESSWDSGKSQSSRDDQESREPVAPRRNNWIFVNEEQAFAGARGTGRGRSRGGFREFSSRGDRGGRGGRGGENPRGSYNNNSRDAVGAQRPGRGRGLPRDFVKVEDLQRGKPRRRNVSETLSETSEYEELPKRRRQKGSENGEGGSYPEQGETRKADRDSWRSNKVYTEDQAASDTRDDKAKACSRGFGGGCRSLPPRLDTGRGYNTSRGFNSSRDPSTWRGQGTQFGSSSGGPMQENGYCPGTETLSRRPPPAEREPLKYTPKFTASTGSFMENGTEDRGLEGEYYIDNDNPGQQQLRRRRPPRQDKPPRFRRLRQEREPGSGQWTSDEYINGSDGFANPWPGRSKEGCREDGWPSGHYSGGGGRSGGQHGQAEDWETGSENSDFNDWREKRAGGQQQQAHGGDVHSDSGHGELGSVEKRELAKRSFSSQRPLVDRQNRKVEPALLEGNKMTRSSENPNAPPSCNRNDGWQNGGASNHRRNREESGLVYCVEPSEEGHQPNEPSGKKLDKELKTRSVKGDLAEPLSQYDLNSYHIEGDAGSSSPDGFQDLSKKQQRRLPQEDDRRRKEHGAPVSMKNRPITSKMPPRFAKKQGGMTMDQPEGLSANNLGTEIWETNSSALSVQSSGGDSWTKQVSYTGSEPNSEDSDAGPEQSKEQHKPGPIGNERSLKHRKGSEGLEGGPITPVNGVNLHVDTVLPVPPIEFGVSAKDSDFSLPPRSTPVPVSNPVTKLQVTLANNPALTQAIPMLRRDHLQPGINLNPISFPSADLTLKMESARKAWENSQSLPEQGSPGGVAAGAQPPCSVGSSSAVSYSSFGGVPMPVASVAPSMSMQGNHIPPLYLDGHVFPSQPRLVPPTMTQQQSYQQAAAQQIPISLHTSLQAQAQLGLRGGLPVSQSQEMFNSIPSFRSQVYMHPNLSQPSPMVLSSGGPLKGPYSAFLGMQPSDMVKPQSGSHYQPMNGSQAMVYDSQMNQGPGMGSSQLMDSQLIQVTMPLPGSQLRYGSAQQHLILPQSIQLQQGQNLSVGAARRMLPPGSQPPVMTGSRENFPISTGPYTTYKTSQMEMKGFQFSDKPNHSQGMPGGYNRPGSASPSGKPSGPMPGHYTQQKTTPMQAVQQRGWACSGPGLTCSCCYRDPATGWFEAPLCPLHGKVPPPQGSMVMHMRPPTTGPFPTPIQRPVMQVNKTVIIRSPPYPNPGREPPHSTPPLAPEPSVKGPEDGMKVSHPL